MSLYDEDIARLDRLIAELKVRDKNANKSHLIREALRLVDLTKVRPVVRGNNFK